jgi:spore coat polysaccharide biosynthesis protein SpsF (cytidylyltransferase family)
MKYLALIQARCDSSRLKGKVLQMIVGKPVLRHVIERVQRSQYIDEVMVITSIQKSNLSILRLCADMGIRVYVGSENDVLDRYYQAARLLQPEYIIRITGDCPLFDAGLLDQAIEQLKDTTDYLGMLSETLADGLDLEIIKYSALSRAWKEANLQSQREHATQYIIRNQHIFNLQDFVSQIGDFGDKRWTLDEPEDFEFITSVFEHFDRVKKNNFNYIDILNYLKSNPELEKVNARFSRNEGLAKSLANDFSIENDEVE